MPLPTTVRTYLDGLGLSYRVTPHAAGANLHQIASELDLDATGIARTVMLREGASHTLAILPGDAILDFTALCALRGGDVEPLFGPDLDELPARLRFAGPGFFPPLPGLLEIPAVLDPALLRADEIHFEAGNGSEFIAVSRADFERLVDGAARGTFSAPLATLGTLPADTGSEGLLATVQRYSPHRLRSGVESLRELPPLPATASKLLELRLNPDATAADLAALVELDASLASQVMRWANSALYGFQGQVRSIEQAVARVLGFEMTLNLALGVAIGRTFKVPATGPLGLAAFWRHSVYCASLCAELAAATPKSMQLDRGTAYLAGLLHDFGHLLLGHLFPSQFFLLNRFVAANPQLPLSKLEQYVLGVDHATIGAWLMQAWGMPTELTTALRHHHDQDLLAPDTEYAALVQIANRMLAPHDAGDEPEREPPRALLAGLDISEESAEAALRGLLDRAGELDDFARRLVS